MMATVGAGQEQEEQFVLAVVRGDLEVNETKLANAAKAREMRPATAEEIAATGAVPGYGSPIGVKGALVIVDESVATSPNLVAGANEVGYHIKNVNCGRDFEPDIVADIAAAQDGDGCPRCAAAMRTSRGVEIGNIFQLGSKYTQAMGGNFLDANGKSQPVIMGSYGIGVGRLLACIAEEYHDDNGLVWPISVAPFQVLITLLAKGEGEAQTVAEKLYGELRELGIEVLFDERRENPGVKFKDADLIGIPLRVTVGDRGLKKGVVECKLRREDERGEVPVDAAVEHIVAAVRRLEEELVACVVPVEYQE
jgi:prolyl-tRNA synthetase